DSKQLDRRAIELRGHVTRKTRNFVAGNVVVSDHCLEELNLRNFRRVWIGLVGVARIARLKLVEAISSRVTRAHDDLGFDYRAVGEEERDLVHAIREPWCDRKDGVRRVSVVGGLDRQAACSSDRLNGFRKTENR